MSDSDSDSAESDAASSTSLSDSREDPEEGVAVVMDAGSPCAGRAAT